MSAYQRTTRACSLEQLRPDVRQTIENYLQAAEPKYINCCETISQKRPQSWLTAWLNTGQEDSIYTAMVLTDQVLIWVRAGEHSAARLTSAKLNEIHVKPFVSLFSNDQGLEIAGLIENARSTLRGYIGMGPEQAAQNFCEQAQAAVEKVNPTPARKFPSWMGGK